MDTLIIILLSIAGLWIACGIVFAFILAKSGGEDFVWNKATFKFIFLWPTFFIR